MTPSPSLSTGFPARGAGHVNRAHRGGQARLLLCGGGETVTRTKRRSSVASGANRRLRMTLCNNSRLERYPDASRASAIIHDLWHRIPFFASLYHVARCGASNVNPSPEYAFAALSDSYAPELFASSKPCLINTA